MITQQSVVRKSMKKTALAAFMLSSVTLGIYSIQTHADGGSGLGGGGTDVSDSFTSWCIDPLERLREAMAKAESFLLNQDFRSARTNLQEGLSTAMDEAGENATANSLTAQTIAQGINMAKSLAKETQITEQIMVEQFYQPYYQEISFVENTIDENFYRRCQWDAKKCATISGTQYDSFIKSYERAFLAFVSRKLSWVNGRYVSRSETVPPGEEFKRYKTKGPAYLYLKVMELSLASVKNDLPASPFYHLYDCQMRKISDLYKDLSAYNAGKKATWIDEPHAVYETAKRSGKIVEKLGEAARLGIPQCH